MELHAVSATERDRCCTPTSWRRALRAIGAERYHIRHPFHRLLHDGRLDKGQVQAWALNRYYYQASIPLEGRLPAGAPADHRAAPRMAPAAGGP